MLSRFSILFLAAIGLMGCVVALPVNPEASLPPVPAGMARVFFYRDADYAESGKVAQISLNNQEVGLLWRGEVFYRDIAPGTYLISVSSDLAFPNQFKNARIEAGQIRYAKIESLMSWGGMTRRGNPIDLATYVVALIDADQAHYDIGQLRLTAGSLASASTARAPAS